MWILCINKFILFRFSSFLGDWLPSIHENMTVCPYVGLFHVWNHIDCDWVMSFQLEIGNVASFKSRKKKRLCFQLNAYRSVLLLFQVFFSFLCVNFLCFLWAMLPIASHCICVLVSALINNNSLFENTNKFPDIFRFCRNFFIFLFFFWFSIKCRLYQIIGYTENKEHSNQLRRPPYAL